MPIITDWKALTGTLSDDAACEALGDVATTNLLYVLHHALRHATKTSAASGGRHNQRCKWFPLSSVIHQGGQCMRWGWRKGEGEGVL